MLIVFFRTLILFSLVLVVMRLMGKRQIGELQPFEFVVTLMIADLVAVPMQDKEIALINGIIPVLTLLFAQLAISYICLRSTRIRSIVCGTPTILVRKGELVEKSMKKNLYNMNDLMEQLRAKGYPNLEDVEYAILETNGDLSVIPKSQKRPVNPGDLKINADYEGLPLLLIVDGSIIDSNLKEANLTQEWLYNALTAQGLTPETTLVATVDSKGKLFLQRKSN